MAFDPSAPFVGLVNTAAEKYGVSADLLSKMIGQESGWNPDAVSNKGARGLAQFMPATAREYGVDVTDPASSIDGMARYMRDLLKLHKGDTVKAVASYNWGQGNVIRKGLENAPEETRKYVKKILGHDLSTTVPAQHSAPLHNLPTYFSQKQREVNTARIAEATEKAEEEQPERSGSELFEAGKRLDWIGTNISEWYKSFNAAVDPAYKPRSIQEETEYLKSLNVDPTHAARLREAVSADHYFTILNRIKEETEAAKAFEGQGIRGFGYRMLANFADPIGLGIGIATGGVGWGLKGRAAFTAAQAGMGAATAGSVEALLFGLQETRSQDDIWASMLGGMVLQGGLGQLGYRAEREVSRAIFAGARAQALHDVMTETRLRGNTQVADQIETRLQAEEAAGFGADSVGAARVDGTMTLPEQKVAPDIEKLIDDEIDAPTTSFGYKTLRQDIAGFLGNSENPVMRTLSRMVEDGVGLKRDANGNLVGSEISAEEVAIRLSHTTESDWLREMNAAFAEFDQGGFMGRAQRYAEFQNQVRHIYELGSNGIPVAAPIQRAVDATKRFFDTFKKEAQEAGLNMHMVDGNYLAHITDNQRWHEFNDKYGLGNVVELLKTSLWNKAEKNGLTVRDPEIYQKLQLEHDVLKDARVKKLQELQKAHAKVMSLEAQVRQGWKERGSAEATSTNDLTAENLIKALETEGFTPESATLTKEVESILEDLDGAIKDLEAEVAAIEKEITDHRIAYHKNRTREGRKEASEIRKGADERLKEAKQLLKEHQTYRKSIEADLKAGQREMELYMRNKEVESEKQAKTDKKEAVKEAKQDVKDLEAELRKAKADAERASIEYQKTKESYHDAYAKMRKEKDVLDNWEANLKEIHGHLARGYAENILRYGDTRHLIGFSGFDFEDATTLRAMLADANVPESKIDSIVSTLGVKVAGPETGRAKNRVDWDMGAKLKVMHEGQEVELSMTDLFVKDLGALTQMYSRQMAGHIAMGKTLGIKSKAQFMQVLQKARDMHPGQAEGTRLIKEIKYAENAYDRLVGLHRDHDPKAPLASAAAPWLHRLRGFNFITKMTQVGFAQIAEIARVLQTVGLQAAWKQMPVLREIYKLGKDGKLNNALLRELEAATGIGTSRLRSQVFTGIDEDSLVSVGGKIDKLIHKGTNLVSDVSGFNAITLMQQRMAMAGFSQRIVDLARKVGGDVTKLKPNQLKEFASYGLNEKKLAAVFSHLNDSTKVTIERGSKLHRLNLETWDTEASSALTMALQRMARRVVQEGSIGTSLPLMSSMLGKLLFQFRNFAITAFTKQFLNGLAQRDMRTFLGFLSTVVFGGVSYALQTAANYGGTDQFEEKMTFDRVAAASLARSGYSSILPMTIDSLVEMGSGGEVPGPFSQGARSSNLAAGVITGSASMDTISGALKLGSLPFTALSDDHDLTKGDFEKMVRLIPFANMVGIKRGLMEISEDLPKTSGAKRIKTFYEAFE